MTEPDDRGAGDQPDGTDAHDDAGADAGTIASYLAKYLSKALVLDTPARRSTDGILDRAAHYEKIMQTCADLAREPDLKSLRLLRHLHTLGCGARIATRSRTYSSTLRALRGEQQAYAAAQAGIDLNATVIADSHWEYAGSGWPSPEQDAYAAAQAAQISAAREQRARQASRTDPNTQSPRERS